jgi:hypothetical protein
MRSFTPRSSFQLPFGTASAIDMLRQQQDQFPNIDQAYPLPEFATVGIIPGDDLQSVDRVDPRRQGHQARKYGLYFHTILPSPFAVFMMAVVRRIGQRRNSIHTHGDARLCNNIAIPIKQFKYFCADAALPCLGLF